VEFTARSQGLGPAVFAGPSEWIENDRFSKLHSQPRSSLDQPFKGLDLVAFTHRVFDHSSVAVLNPGDAVDLGLPLAPDLEIAT
jgi:hypothetical protein